MPGPDGQQAVVIGASMAGLAATRVLADRFDAVTILDRDELPDGSDARKGVPQGRQARRAREHDDLRTSSKLSRSSSTKPRDRL